MYKKVDLDVHTWRISGTRSCRQGRPPSSVLDLGAYDFFVAGGSGRTTEILHEGGPWCTSSLQLLDTFWHNASHVEHAAASLSCDLSDFLMFGNSWVQRIRRISIAAMEGATIRWQSRGRMCTLPYNFFTSALPRCAVSSNEDGVRASSLDL